MLHPAVNKIIRDIKSIKIQGAVNVAIAGLKALEITVDNSKALTRSSFLLELENVKDELFQSRPTEPCLRNAIHYVVDDLNGADIVAIKKQAYLKIKDALNHFSSAEESISSIGARKIENNSIVFTHCHSSTVINVLKRAKDNGIKFRVHNTETRPLFQGRKTAKELADYGIAVTHFVDSAARLAMKKADIVLLGADAITSEGKVINKIGSELFCEAAFHLRVPVYVCTDSWKFDPMTVFGYEEVIEQRAEKEVWRGKPNNVLIDNHAFEKINPNLISGIISELGVYKPSVFVEEIRRNYKWMFQ